MAEYLIIISYDRKKFRAYNRLIEKLEQVQDSLVYPLEDEFAKLMAGPFASYLTFSEKSPIVTIGLFKIRGDEIIPTNAFVNLYASPKKVEAYISRDKKVGEATVSNDEEAILKLVYYTGYVLSQVTKESKYLIPREVKEDIKKIKVRYVNVFQPIGVSVAEEFKQILANFGCNLTNIYYFDMIYEYPYRMRRVTGFGYCCGDKLFALGGLADSEHGDIPEEEFYPPYTLKFSTDGCSPKDIANVLYQKASTIEVFIRSKNNI